MLIGGPNVEQVLGHQRADMAVDDVGRDDRRLAALAAPSERSGAPADRHDKNRRGAAHVAAVAPTVGRCGPPGHARTQTIGRR